MAELAEQIDKASAAALERRPLLTELQRMEGQIQAALPEHFPGGAERFIRIVTTAVRLAPELAKCTPVSLLGASMQAAQLGLTPGVLGECWLIPYKNKGVQEASFQIGWRGMVALARRSGLRVTGAVVYENDAFDWELGLTPRLVHKPWQGENRGKAIYWYAIVREASGELAGFAVLDRAMVEKRRRVSRSPDSPAWTNWYDEMALGKAAREALRFAPLTVEMGTALASEETVRTSLTAHPEEMAELEPLEPLEPLELQQP